ncbi:MAG: hypothetical protein D6778_07735 [Nitrospirae bacterium]|nr:MAG: hypothetical protein D6778_07735 [Nitrospirota bacterium]
MDTQGVQEVLNEITRKVPGTEGAFLITADGFPVVSTLETGEQEGRCTAVGAILYDAAQKAVAELHLGGLEAVITKATEGYFVISHAQDELFLMVLAKEDVPMGLVLMRMKKALPVLRKLL